jgi:hypothetical protein
VYVHIPSRVIIMDVDGIGPYTRVHDVGCSPASACLYRYQVMNALPQGRGNGHVYSARSAQLRGAKSTLHVISRD